MQQSGFKEDFASVNGLHNALDLAADGDFLAGRSIFRLCFGCDSGGHRNVAGHGSCDLGFQLRFQFVFLWNFNRTTATGCRSSSGFFRLRQCFSGGCHLFANAGANGVCFGNRCSRRLGLGFRLRNRLRCRFRMRVGWCCRRLRWCGV